ncbi:MAG: EamA family transporter [Candidatus Woesearchaeota archaeon]|jgi:drug/metabolite transporter (DMT)-like permease|nr:EamA family transporter [Candidatus Woesearchaeota archaeon]MDP7457436.1 EamA family transporter [Candidatus Woesearchaeota archaeon]
MLWLLLSLTAALLSGVGIVVIKEALLKEHAMEYCTVYAFFSFLWTLILLPRVNFHLSITQFILIYIAATLITLALLFEAKGIRHLEVSIASPLLAFGPAIALILSFVFLKEKISALNSVGIFLIVFGAYYLETHSLSIHIIEPLRKLISHKHTMYIFIAMVLIAVGVVVEKYIVGTVDIYTFIFFFALFIFINFLILIHIFHDGFHGISHGIKNAGKWILLTSLIFFVVRLLYFKAISLFQVSLVYPVLKTNTLFSTVIGGKLFHDHNLLPRTIASLIMVAGVFLVVL